MEIGSNDCAWMWIKLLLLGVCICAHTQQQQLDPQNPQNAEYRKPNGKEIFFSLISTKIKLNKKKEKMVYCSSVPL